MICFSLFLWGYQGFITQVMDLVGQLGLIQHVIISIFF
jgi:hypothetical protein